MTPHLETTLARLDSLAAVDPRLEQYRIGANPTALDHLSGDRVLSDDMVALITEGGWWPGAFSTHHYRDQHPLVSEPDLADFLVYGVTIDDGPPGEVEWFPFGTVEEGDRCHTPAITEPQPDAPVLMMSNKGLWTSMAFPTEAALLEAFAITIETLGFDNSEYPWIDPAFVEWVTEPPNEWQSRPETLNTHRHIAAAAAAWSSNHRCWNTDLMPFMIDGIKVPAPAIATILGIDAERIHVKPPRKRRLR